jgi:hypothetical protein
MFERPCQNKESWEVLRELGTLGKHELIQRLQQCNPPELDDIAVACRKAAPGGSAGSDGGIHIARANARRAGMELDNFLKTISRIEQIVWEIEEKKETEKAK